MWTIPFAEIEDELNDRLARSGPLSLGTTFEEKRYYREEIGRRMREIRLAIELERLQAPPETSPKPLDTKFSDLRERQEAKKITPDPPSSNGNTLKSSKFNQANFTEIAKAYPSWHLLWEKDLQRDALCRRKRA